MNTSNRFKHSEYSSASETYRHIVNLVTIVASGAFAGGNLFIGASLGTYWLSLPPMEFVSSFVPQFKHFLYSIMPLYLITLWGLVLSAERDWHEPELKKHWQKAIALFVGLSAITIFYHVPENLRLLEQAFTTEKADFVRHQWLLWHIPRILMSFAVTVFAVRAVMLRNQL